VGSFDHLVSASEQRRWNGEAEVTLPAVRCCIGASAWFHAVRCYSDPAIPISSRTLRQRAISESRNRCRSSGNCGLAGIIPFLTIHDCTSGAAKNGTTSERSLFTICAGVFAGATSMIQPTASKPGTPASAGVDVRRMTQSA
jgi:hypothetical protein